ncbi:hypothetical protein D9757_012149 [Collybiopsis confluens]|uniref:Uncharacterized protein n=1 Tax=Collybiopsis confluens TaxID=2823264 RepID=A0A8H5G7V1_9AGAR|nr:hypothetical protein D9757_012149 [Collybiopsis confluens]
MLPSIVKQLEREKHNAQVQIAHLRGALQDVTNNLNRSKGPIASNELGKTGHHQLRPLRLLQGQLTQESLPRSSHIISSAPTGEPQCEPQKPIDPNHTHESDRDQLQAEMELWLQQWLDEESERRAFFNTYPKNKNIPTHDRDKAIIFFWDLRERMAGGNGQ